MESIAEEVKDVKSTIAGPVKVLRSGRCLGLELHKWPELENFDTKFICSDGECEAHRLVLCHVSEYLRSLLRGQDQRDVTYFIVPDISKEIMHRILEITYKGRTTGTIEVLDAVMEAMSYMGWLSDYYEYEMKEVSNSVSSNPVEAPRADIIVSDHIIDPDFINAAWKPTPVKASAADAEPKWGTQEAHHCPRAKSAERANNFISITPATARSSTAETCKATRGSVHQNASKDDSSSDDHEAPGSRSTPRPPRRRRVSSRLRTQCSVCKHSPPLRLRRRCRATPAGKSNRKQGERTYVVNKILDKKSEDGTVKYLISWKGFSNKDNSWEPEEMLLEDIPEMIAEFNEKLAAKENTETEGMPTTSTKKSNIPLRDTPARARQRKSVRFALSESTTNSAEGDSVKTSKASHSKIIWSRREEDGGREYLLISAAGHEWISERRAKTEFAVALVAFLEQEVDRRSGPGE